VSGPLPKGAAGAAFAQPGAWVDTVTNAGERYLPLVARYDASMHLGHMASYREALRHSQGRRVLDLGCGTGYGAFFLTDLGARSVVGCDFSEEALDYARQVYAHPRLTYIRADAQRLPFADGAFDFVFSSQVIEHLTSPEQMLHEVRRVLAPGGYCLVTTPNKRLFSPEGSTENVHHVSEMDLGAYRRLAERVFPRVEMRGIPQRCLVLRPGAATPSAKPNDEIRPEDYRVQTDDLNACENMLCFGLRDAEGRLAEAANAVADELEPIFWDPSIRCWVTMGTQVASSEIVSARDGLYRVEIDLPEGWVPSIHDSGGQLVGRGEQVGGRSVATFQPLADSRGRRFVLSIRRRSGLARWLPRGGPPGPVMVRTLHADLIRSYPTS
jgi:SAM-dependent methyltransferase